VSPYGNTRFVEPKRHLAQVRLILAAFSLALILSGITAIFPLEGLRLLAPLYEPGSVLHRLWPEMAAWLALVRTGLVDVNAVVTDMHGLFAPFLADSGVTSDVSLVDPRPRIRGTVASLEAIISNLMINSINALNTPGWGGRRREIGLRSEISGDAVLIRVADSGPGIAGLAVDEIWLPGRTTMPGGTGLGLTIVRDAATDLGGDTHAIAHGELGGAEFVVELPLAVEDR